MYSINKSENVKQKNMIFLADVQNIAQSYIVITAIAAIQFLTALTTQGPVV